MPSGLMELANKVRDKTITEKESEEFTQLMNQMMKRACDCTHYLTVSNENYSICNIVIFFTAYGKTSDLNGWTLPSGKKGEGYLPKFPGFGVEIIMIPPFV